MHQHAQTHTLLLLSAMNWRLPNGTSGSLNGQHGRVGRRERGRDSEGSSRREKKRRSERWNEACV